MDRIDGIRAFVAVVDAGSFTRAGERLGISNKLVSKYVAALEGQQGVTLLNRTTRALSLRRGRSATSRTTPFSTSTWWSSSQRLARTSST